MVNQMKEMDPEMIRAICEQLQPLHRVSRDVFTKYGVKRGLRNADGTGVLAGITRLGNVHGYLLNEGEREPIEGHLTYRGIDIYDLLYAFQNEDRFGFEEVGYLLLSGSLPTREQLDRFTEMIGEARSLPDNFTEDMIMRAPSRDIMNKLASATLALYSYDPNPDDISTENILRQGISLMAKYPVIISHAYQARRRYFEGQSMYLHVPDPKLSTAENILRLIRPDESYTDDEAKLLDRCLILHAEHGGGNNSAFATRVTTSSGTDTYSSIAAAVGSLKGPRHGGANLKVVQMFNDIKEHVADWKDEDEVSAYLTRLLNREAFDHAGLIYGMGHAVYSLSDPRADIFRSFVKRLAQEKGRQDEYELYFLTERLAKEVIAKERKIYKGVSANVDFYSGFVYSMLDLPTELFTPIFAMARIVGWSAHRIEELNNGGKIIRPAYKSIARHRDYTPLKKR